MAVFASFSEALVLGLTSGPACIAACGPVLVPSLLTQNAGLRPNAHYLSVFLSARLLGYLLFAAVAWELGALASLLPASRILMMGAVDVILAGVLFWYAYSAKHICGHACSESKLVTIGAAQSHRTRGAAVLGLLTGITLCPPFVAAGFRAAQLGSVFQALLFFTFFFVGTSVWFVPYVGLGCVVRNQAVVTVARMAMGLIAVYYLLIGVGLLLGSVNTTSVGGDGSPFFSDRGMRSDAYRVSASDDRRRDGENGPRPFGLRRKSGHTSFSPLTVDPPQPAGSASSGPIFARSATRRGSVNRP